MAPLRGPAASPTEIAHARWDVHLGHEVTRVVRSFKGIAPGEKVVVWHPEQNSIERANLEGHDVVIHLAGENIAGVYGTLTAILAGVYFGSVVVRMTSSGE